MVLLTPPGFPLSVAFLHQLVVVGEVYPWRMSQTRSLGTHATTELHIVVIFFFLVSAAVLCWRVTSSLGLLPAAPAVEALSLE